MATLVFYNSFKESQLDGSVVNTPIDFDTDTINVALVTSSYTPDATTHDLWDDASANEVSGTNYTAFGETIANMTVTETGGTVTVDGDDVSWLQDGSGFSDARYGILFKTTGVTTTSPLIGYIDFTTDKGNVSGDLTIQWNASGIFTLA